MILHEVFVTTISHVAVMGTCFLFF